MLMIRKTFSAFYHTDDIFAESSSVCGICIYFLRTFKPGTGFVYDGSRSFRLSFPSPVFALKVCKKYIQSYSDYIERKVKPTRKDRNGGEKCVATGRKVSGESVQRELPPAIGLEAREDQLMSLAVNQAEQMLRKGNAPTQIVVHYLRLATTKNQLEKEKLRKENILLEAKASAIESAARSEELYLKAIEAMREYSGSLVRNYEEQ